MNVKEQKEDFNKLTSDVNRWAWVMDVNKVQIDNNEAQTLLIQLDNDQTYLIIGNDEDDDDYFEFKESIGNDGGVFELLRSLRINCESV